MVNKKRERPIRRLFAIIGSRFANALIITLFLLALVGNFCTTATAVDFQRSAGEALGEPKVLGPLYNVAGKLLVQLNKQFDGRNQDNLIMSPVSIHQALSVLLSCSDANSETRQELKTVMGYANMSESDIQQCDVDFRKLMAEFQQVTSKTMKERANFEAVVKAENLTNDELQSIKPRSPFIVPFTVLVTKNKGAKIKLDCEKNAAEYYHATIENIDDRKPATKTELLTKINNWAKEAGFEEPMVDEQYFDDSFDALLLSATRFEAFWTKKFNRGADLGVFFNYGVDNDSIPVKKYREVRFMQGMRLLEFMPSKYAERKFVHENMSKDPAFKQLCGLNFRAVTIPLHNDITLAIFEPRVEPGSSSNTTTIPQLNKLIGDLFSSFDKRSSTTNLAKALKLLDRPKNRNHIDRLRIPFMNFNNGIDMRSTLKSIGLKRILDRERAEPSNMESKKLHISDFKHKARITLTVNGFEASETDGGYIARRRPSSNLSITRPFMFVVRYHKIPLFVGQFTNYNENDNLY